MKVIQIPCGEFANESERLAFEAVKQKISAWPGNDEWYILTNFAHSSSARYQSDEIDQLIVGPTGVFVIEVKHWDRAWMKRNANLVDSECDKYVEKVRRVATNARRRFEPLGLVPRRMLLTAESKAIGSSGRLCQRGVEFFALKEIKELLDLGGVAQLSPPVVKDLCEQLEPRTRVNVTGNLRRLGDFINLEAEPPTPEGPFHRVYRGSHARTKDKIILHLYDLSADIPGTDRNGAENLAAREFETMQRLQKSPCVPRFRDSLQDVQGFVGEMKFFTVVDPCAPSIQQRAADETWTTKSRIEFATRAVQGLASLHGFPVDMEESDDTQIIHRNLRPSNILVTARNRVLFTGFSLTRIRGLSTVPAKSLSADDDPFVAPEVRKNGLSSGEQMSDVYSLAASLLTIFQDKEDANASECRGILETALSENSSERPPLSQLAELLRVLTVEDTPIPTKPVENLIEDSPPLPRYWSEDLIVLFNNKSFRIVSRLGAGGIGQTFKVVEVDPATGENFGTYVGKVINEEAAGIAALKAYRQVRPHTDDDSLSVIYETASHWTNNSFVALLKWVEGDSLSNLYGVLPLVSEECGEASVESLALRWCKDLCQALSRLHRVGYVHADVTPANIIVHNGEVTLTDYDLVAPVGTRASGCGALMFCSPEAQGRQPLNFSDDLFALGASLFRAVTDRDSFPTQGGNFDKTTGVQWLPDEKREMPIISDFVSRATSPIGSQRFESAMAALEWLDAKLFSHSTEKKPTTLPITFSANEVPWLASVLQVYPGSAYGNIETRGLDSKFASDTYVETALEESLFKDLAERRIRLLILCGNAGDGKTALLQHLAKRFGVSELTSANRIWEATTADGLRIKANLDGAASFGGQTANQLLDEFFSPFLKGKPNQDVAHLLAINDGRLLEWIDRSQTSGQATPLVDELSALLEQDNSNSASHVRLIDLNSRSLVGDIDSKANLVTREFLDNLIDRLLGGERANEIWKACETCSALARCQAGRTSSLLRKNQPGGLGERIRSRLAEALQAVHQRAEVHITARELRGTLSYILFGIQYCRQIHERPESPSGYWDLAFDPDSPLRQGDVLRELTFLDPALEAHPMVDRRLSGHGTRDTSNAGPAYPELSLSSARRRAFFEWLPAEIQAVANSIDALGLAHGRHLREFKEAGLRTAAGNSDLCARLCKGISRLEDLPRLALERSKKGHVALKISPRTPTESIFWVEKSLESFSLTAELPLRDSRFPVLHRRLRLTYSYQDQRTEILSMGYELFHTLLELESGFQLNDTTSDDLFANLAIFTQRLAQEGETILFAWNPQDDETIYHVTTGKGAEHQLLICTAVGDK